MQSVQAAQILKFSIPDYSALNQALPSAHLMPLFTEAIFTEAIFTQAAFINYLSRCNTNFSTKLSSSVALAANSSLIAEHS